jgi:hypothetical protein
MRFSIFNALAGAARSVWAARRLGNALDAVPAQAIGMTVLGVGAIAVISTGGALSRRRALRRQHSQQHDDEDQARTEHSEGIH